jgi:uncharacterized protein (TIGR03000 family)
MTPRRLAFILVAVSVGADSLLTTDAFSKSVRSGKYGNNSGYRPNSSASTATTSIVRTYYISPRIAYSIPYSQPPNNTSRDVNGVARLRVKVPADADVWINKHKMAKGKTVRKFVSRRLQPGKNYTYRIRVRRQENGREVVQTRQIAVRAGLRTTVDFTEPSPTKAMSENSETRK